MTFKGGHCEERSGDEAISRSGFGGVTQRRRRLLTRAAAQSDKCGMTKDQVLKRVPTWPDRQQELAELGLEIEAEVAGAEYDATPDELAAIDEGLTGEAASEGEVEAAFAVFRRV
jgi:hypothetical protein